MRHAQGALNFVAVSFCVTYVARPSLGMRACVTRAVASGHSTAYLWRFLLTTFVIQTELTKTTDGVRAFAVSV